MDTPANAYRYKVFLSSGDVPESERGALMEEFTSIATPYWHVEDPELYDVIKRSMFAPEFGLAVARLEGAMVGFYLFRRVTLEGSRVLCPMNLHVAEAHQARGIRSEFARIVTRAVLTEDASPLYYGYRTRNPFLWRDLARRCKALVPSLFGEPSDTRLLAMAERVVKTVYPDAIVDMPDLVVRDAYRGILYRKEPHHPDRDLDAAFYAPLKSPYDARFFFGATDPARLAP
jgi:hypothetical protein